MDFQPKTPFKNSDAHAIYKANIGVLTLMLPKIFNKQFPKPLSIGIDREIKNLTDWDEKTLRCVLFVWTRRMEYVMSALSFGTRHSLEGEKEALVSYEALCEFTDRLNGFRDKFRIQQFRVDFEKAHGYPALQCAIL